MGELASLNFTPRGSRIHIAFFGLRNAGKSTLVNAFTNSDIAIVSEVAGTTTDPVSKAMEILPLGPCTITDTAGLDDEGALGELRVEKSLAVLKTADVAVWVGEGFDKWRHYFKIPVLKYNRGESVEALKAAIAGLKLAETPPPLLEGLVTQGDTVLCVCPIDESAPKGRLILPQQQVIRECLDLGAAAVVCQPALVAAMADKCSPRLAITDSQAFGEVRRSLKPEIRLTSFSILFARQKGDLAAYREGLKAIPKLQAGDKVLIAEGCTHHRQCNDIGAVKIPKALRKLTGKELKFEFASGANFTADLADVKLVVHCGACMLTRREMLQRIGQATLAGVPIVNYGMLLALAQGVDLESAMV